MPNELAFQAFKKAVVDRLLRMPSAPSRFSSYMFKQFDSWKSFSSAQWLELFEAVRRDAFHGVYDFLYFFTCALGLDVYTLFLYPTQWPLREYRLICDIVDPAKHNVLASQHFFSQTGMEDLMRMRRVLKQEGLPLSDVNYVQFAPEQEPNTYIIRIANFDASVEFEKWKKRASIAS